MRTLLKAGVLACAGTVVACGADAEPPDDTCNDEPICSAFWNSGAYGGRVSVRIDAVSGEAVVTTNGLASHAMGPYGANPNEAVAQDLELRFPLVAEMGPSEAGLGHVGVAWDGVGFFNPSDGHDIGGCTGNAAYLEANHVDSYGGHPTPRGEYHYHTGDFLRHAEELGLEHSTAGHSSLLGYARDGVPMYGPYGYAEGADASSPIRELRSCYRLRASRTCCVEPALCSEAAAFDGKELVMGAFVEDFEYDAEGHAAGTCDLDEFNSRVAVTPEYPEGARVYVMTFDVDGRAAFPFMFGVRYWGRVDGAR